MVHRRHLSHRNRHRETAQGALALPLQQNTIASTVLDPYRVINSGGIGWFDRTTGRRDETRDGFGVVYDTDGGFGKAHGLGDLELLCDEPPVQIGNRVWLDDGGGTQNARYDETLGIQGMTVTLKDSTGQVIAKKKTDAKGEYYFDHRDGLLPNTAYTVEFDKTTVDTSNLPGGITVADLMWTRTTGSDPATNSDAEPTGGDEKDPTAVATVTTGPPGSVNHDLDAGMSGRHLTARTSQQNRGARPHLPKRPGPSACLRPGQAQDNRDAPSGRSAEKPGSTKKVPEAVAVAKEDSSSPSSRRCCVATKVRSSRWKQMNSSPQSSGPLA
ncbi:hypothetical protein SALBM311S_11794 [Streptomyces alboniger]